MAFAAAAVVGARRAGRMGPSSITPAPGSLGSSSLGGPGMGTSLSICMSALFVVTGVSCLVNSLANARQELVQDYDSSVQLWIGEARDVFAGSRLTVEAVVTSPNSSLTVDMKLVNYSEPTFRDAEEGKGLLGYTPLRFEANLAFDSYYPQNRSKDSSSDMWELLPTRDEASTVVVRFSMRNSSGHVSMFSTQPWPLVYDEVVRARTPAPQNKCRQQQHGVWRGRRCHVVKRLSDVCMQVDLDKAGMWQPNSRTFPLEDNSSMSHRPYSTHAPAAFVASSGVQETYGCDPQKAYHPATWKPDSCWGARSTAPKCSLAATSPHLISIVVRSASDPFIRAEELTDNSLNFGLSPASQLTFGTILLFLGCVLCLVPCVRLYAFCKRKRRSGSDARSLKHGVQEADFGCDDVYSDQL